MKDKEQIFLEIESLFGRHEQRDWKSSVELIKYLIKEYPNDVDVYIRVIYILHNILLEENYPKEEHDNIANLLFKCFEKSYILFSENAEYLFFIGKILHIAEWYFGLNDNKLALEMQKKAMDKEKGNLLYEWAYRLSCSMDYEEGYLAHQLIEQEKDKIDWLKSKGFPGNYILNHLQMSNQNYLKRKASGSS